MDETTQTQVQTVASLTDAEREAGEKQGLQNVVAESAETNAKTRDPATETESAGDRWPDRSDIMQFEGLLDLGPDAFEAKIAADAENPVAESKVAGLLGLERSGRNRDVYVNAMCARLGVKSPYEVTHAGPAWTNPITKVNPL